MGTGSDHSPACRRLKQSMTSVPDRHISAMLLPAMDIETKTLPASTAPKLPAARLSAEGGAAPHSQGKSAGDNYEPPSPMSSRQSSAQTSMFDDGAASAPTTAIVVPGSVLNSCMQPECLLRKAISKLEPLVSAETKLEEASDTSVDILAAVEASPDISPQSSRQSSLNAAVRPPLGIDPRLAVRTRFASAGLQQETNNPSSRKSSPVATLRPVLEEPRSALLSPLVHSGPHSVVEAAPVAMQTACEPRVGTPNSVASPPRAGTAHATMSGTAPLFITSSSQGVVVASQSAANAPVPTPTEITTVPLSAECIPMVKEEANPGVAASMHQEDANVPRVPVTLAVPRPLSGSASTRSKPGLISPLQREAQSATVSQLASSLRPANAAGAATAAPQMARTAPTVSPLQEQAASPRPSTSQGGERVERLLVRAAKSSASSSDYQRCNGNERAWLISQKPSFGRHAYLEHCQAAICQVDEIRLTQTFCTHLSDSSGPASEIAEHRLKYSFKLT